MRKVSRPFIINGAAPGCTSEVHHRRNVCLSPSSQKFEFRPVCIYVRLRPMAGSSASRCSSFFFFLYAPIFLTYRLEDEPPAGRVFVKHFMTHGLFYNRINCTTIRILVCCGLPPPAYDHTGFLPKLGSEHLYKRSQMELLIWQTAVITESNQSGLVFSLLSSVGTMF